MRIMTKKQEGRIDKLVELAGGDFSLVEDALRNASSGNAVPKMEEVVHYILIHTKRKSSQKENISATG
jgi:hypothetical protein